VHEREATGTGTPPVPVAQLRQLNKWFGAIRALNDVDLDIFPGVVHGLVGANGAGKSTLLKILGGVERPDEGSVLVDGAEVEFASPRDSQRLGMAFIHQELNLVPTFSAEQNMGLGSLKANRLGMVNFAARSARAAEVAERLRFDFPLSRSVDNLTVAQRWMVSIGRAFMARARLVAMDEPTASLSQDETESLFRAIQELVRHGVSILYVTHRLSEVMAICDEVTVLKDARVQAGFRRGAYSEEQLIRAIVGEAVIAPAAIADRKVAGPVLLEVRNVARAPRVHDVSFSLHEGEVLGLAGLVGSGRTEIARLLFGAEKPTRGDMRLEGEPYAPNSTHDAVRRGFSLVPEERRSQGLLLTQDITFNVNLPSWELTRRRMWPHFLDLKKARQRATDVCARLRVMAPSTATAVKTLSGGNQQKVVIGKWLARSSKVMLLDEPTRGVDVATRAEIYRIVRALAAEGMGVLVISSELDELRVCDRVLLVVEGRIVGELGASEASEAAILHVIYQALAASGASGPAGPRA
jgi:ABC-type sugar transport system ATPase subunit